MARINRNKVMETARRAVEKGQVDKAIREYQKVVQEDPKDVRVWLKIGDLYAKRGDKSEATETYTKVARFYSEQGFYLKAVAVYKQILRLDPRLVEVNLKLAELYRQLGLLSDAMQHFEMVAAFFHREGQTKEALATLRQLVELDKENVATRIKLAELYSKEAMTEEAVTEFAQACDYLRSHNRIDDFIKVAERLLWHKQDNIVLCQELATLYLRRGDPRRALQKLQVCFKANARDVDTLALLAQAFQALDQRGKTVSVLKELARVLTESGKKPQATEVHRRILEFVPDDPDSRQFLGLADPSAEMLVEDDMIVEEPDLAVQEFSPRNGLANPTGSLPLVRSGNVGAPEANSFPPAEVAVVEDDEDFASDFQLAEESSYGSSVSGEENADEIIKVLTETDVYVKYGLHQKAIEHLHRVFELDPDNIEARERLKDILIGQGRGGEAVSQLIHLATLVAPHEPERAETYLRDVVTLEPENSVARSLAARYRLDLSSDLEVEIVDESALDFGQRDGLDFNNAPSAFADQPVGFASGSPTGSELYNEGEFGRTTTDYAGYGGADYVAGDSDMLARGASGGTDSIAVPEAFREEPPAREIFHGGPGTDPGALDPFAAPTAPPVAAHGSEGGYDLDFGDDLGEDSRTGPTLNTSETGSYKLSDDDIILEDEGELDGVTMEVSLDQVEARIGAHETDADELDFDGVQITAAPEDFDADPTPVESQSPYDVGLASAASAPASPFEDEPGDALFTATPDYRDTGTLRESDRATHQVAQPDEVTIDSPIALLVSDDGGTGEAVEAHGSHLEDDLDEADFFISQGLHSEARDILSTLLASYPGHPLVVGKLEELDASAGQAPLSSPIEEAPEPTASKAQVVLEKPVADEDADTHFDLGLAYKEMGLYDEAIAAFNKVIVVAGRAVQCHLMLGLCYREQKNVSEAISQFKAGLYVEPISTAEKFGLYYEIGTCYEALDDPQEALYYYEMIAKKQPDYRDVSERVTRLRKLVPAKTGTRTSL